jgi:hypothetical protein
MVKRQQSLANRDLSFVQCSARLSVDTKRRSFLGVSDGDSECKFVLHSQTGLTAQVSCFQLFPA